MDDKTKTMMLTLASGVIKKALITLGATAATHGVIASNQTETFVSVGMVVVGLAWSFWQDYGKAIILSQLEVLKAKSLAQAAKLTQAGIAPVTASQIADQSPTLTAAEVTKTVASLPPAVQATVAKILLAAFVLSAFLANGQAQAQVKLKSPGEIVRDIQNATGNPPPRTQALTGNPLGDIIGALDVKLLPDLQYALKLATASGSKVTGPCYQAWIDIINVRQKAVQDDQTPPQALPMPDPHLVTDFEKLVELRNSLQPDSEFMIKCSPVASMVKKDIVGFIGIVISGGAGLATLVPGL